MNFDYLFNIQIHAYFGIIQIQIMYCHIFRLPLGASPSKTKTGRISVLEKKYKNQEIHFHRQ